MYWRGIFCRYSEYPRREGSYDDRSETEKAAACPAASTSDYQVAYFGYLNSGAALSASLVVFILATHLSLAVSWVMATEFGDTAT
jgi:hypothetical protein